MKTLILFLLLSLAASTTHAVTAKQMLGQPAPDFVLPSLSGDFLSLDEWRGKVLVINFWASWCTPCRKEIPMFNRLQKDYQGDVQFVAIAIDHLEAVKEFMKKTPIEYPVVFGVRSTTQLVQAYGNSSGVLPYTVFVDRKGRIQTIAPGLLKEAFTRRSIEKLL